MSNKFVTYGDNGAAQVSFEHAGNDMVALFFKLSRGLDIAVVQKDIDNIVANYHSDVTVLADLFVLTFQTRDCRGGKGERALFRGMLLGMYKHFPKEVLASLPLIVEFGYFKDFTLLYEDIVSSSAEGMEELRAALVAVFANQLVADEAAVAKAEAEAMQPEGLSLAAKYAPRIYKKKSATQHATSVATFSRAIRDAIYGPDHPKGSELYRKLLSKLNEQLLTVERLMSANRWSEIEVKRMPGGCLARQRKAFLYEDKKGQIRDPTNKARMELRQRLLDPKAAKKIKGGQIFANELVRSAMRVNSSGEATVLDAQWTSMVAEVQKQCKNFGEQQAAKAAAEGGAAPAEAAPAAPAFDLGNLVPLVDVSGSMSGTPMEVAVAMGLIVSELANPAFRGRVLTFESSPRWHQIKGDNIVEKVKNLMSAPWGGSTNFRAAMLRIIEVIEKVAVAARELAPLPEMIVFSDMQFDVASGVRGRWETTYQTVCRDFRLLGERLAKKGIDIGDGLLEPPTITFWNINARTTGMVTEADTPGVRLLSGFSQSLLKLLLSGALPATPETNKAKTKIDPTETLRAALDDERYDPIRELLASMTAGAFAGYGRTFAAAEFPDLEEDGEEDGDGPDLPNPAKGGGR